jgi:cbb3-type cytochrome oxidase cytochrome c subunit
MRLSQVACGCLTLAALCLVGCAECGREVFAREGCVSCHRFHGTGGSLGPDLSDVGSRLRASAIRAQITDPAVGKPASRMPAFKRLSWFDLHSLAAYLGR